MGQLHRVAPNRSEASSTAEVRGWVGERTVRILEVADGWALVQPWDEPRTWQLVREDLVVAEGALRAVSGEPKVTG
jgi:hypothetical protein